MTAQGREYQTDRETMAANKEAKRLKAAQRYKPKPPPLEDQQQLLRFLDDDDGGDGEDRVQVSDFARLVEKWGSRLRIRATDQEIYFRLTGSHDRVRCNVKSGNIADKTGRKDHCARLTCFTAVCPFERKGHYRSRAGPDHRNNARKSASLYENLDEYGSMVRNGLCCRSKLNEIA